MFNNYLKITLRNLLKNKAYSFINIIGLALGMACSMFIFMYVSHELSYDTYHSNADRIYRVTQKSNLPNGYNLHFARCSVDWINELPKAYPEIETLIRFQRSRITDIKIGENKFRDRHTFKTDADVFEVFDFKLTQGDPEKALSEPYSVVLTESIAQKYFGEESAIGHEISFVGDTQLARLKHIKSPEFFRTYLLIHISKLILSLPLRTRKKEQAGLTFISC